MDGVEERTGPLTGIERDEHTLDGWSHAHRERTARAVRKCLWEGARTLRRAQVRRVTVLKWREAAVLSRARGRPAADTLTRRDEHVAGGGPQHFGRHASEEHAPEV